MEENKKNIDMEQNIEQKEEQNTEQKAEQKAEQKETQALGRLERLALQYYEGANIDQIIEEEFGHEALEKAQSVRKQIQEFRNTKKELEEKYHNMDASMAVFDMIDDTCGDDIEKRFRMTSDMKYLLSMRNLSDGKGVLEEEGADIAFLKETLKKTHEAEQAMAPNAKEDELEALQDELDILLEKDTGSLLEVLEQEVTKTSENETEESKQWETLVEKLKAVDAHMTDTIEEDITVLTAMVILEEESDTTEEEAAYQAAYFMEKQTGTLSHLADLAVSAILVMGGAGLAIKVLGSIFESGLLLAVGGNLWIATLVSTSILGLAACGYGTYKIIKGLIPYGKKLFEKARPYAKKAAEKVKEAVRFVFTTIKDKVVCPVIYWANNTALPVLRENVYYPLKRRLEGLWEWILEKVDKVKAFIKQAATQKPKTSKKQTHFDDEDEFEDEFDEFEHEDDEDEDEEDTYEFSENPDGSQWVLTE